MTFDEWWDRSKTTATPETYKGWEESCRQAWAAGQDDAERFARIDERRRWAKSVDELTLLLRATDARYMALVQQVADGRAMQPATPILVDLGPNVRAERPQTAALQPE